MQVQNGMFFTQPKNNEELCTRCPEGWYPKSAKLCQRPLPRSHAMIWEEMPCPRTWREFFGFGKKTGASRRGGRRLTSKRRTTRRKAFIRR